MNKDNLDVESQKLNRPKLFTNESLINDVCETISPEDLNRSLSAFQSGQDAFSEELRRFNRTVKHIPFIIRK